MTLRRNALGQLGFHVNFEGIVAEVELYGYAWQAGLRPGSRLVEICKVAVASLSHEQMIDLLRTSVTVKVVIIPPHEDSTPRRWVVERAYMWSPVGDLCLHSGHLAEAFTSTIFKCNCVQYTIGAYIKCQGVQHTISAYIKKTS